MDTVCITHGHFDHIHDAVPLASRFSSGGGHFRDLSLARIEGVKNTHPMNKGGSQKIGEVTVTMTHAVHSCGILDDGKIVYGGEAAGYVLRFADGRAIYFAGDTNVFSDMQLIEQLYHPELAFLPIGDLFTMSPREAALACRLLKAKKVIPMHFGTFPPLTGRRNNCRSWGWTSGNWCRAAPWSGKAGAAPAPRHPYSVLLAGISGATGPRLGLGLGQRLRRRLGTVPQIRGEASQHGAVEEVADRGGALRGAAAPPAALRFERSRDRRGSTSTSRIACPPGRRMVDMGRPRQGEQDIDIKQGDGHGYRPGSRNSRAAPRSCRLVAAAASSGPNPGVPAGI